MNTLSWVFLVLTVVCAVADWVVVHRGNQVLEYVFKPLTMILLFEVVLFIDGPPNDVRMWFGLAVLLSMLGDVFLMVPADLFIAGLAAFLLAHLAYIAGLAGAGLDGPPMLVALVGLALLVSVIGVRVVAGARRTDTRLTAPVIAYLAVISLMVMCAFGSNSPWAIAGALLFYTSDAVLGWTRFVEDLPHQRLAVMTTYHLGQIGLVLSLLQLR